VPIPRATNPIAITTRRATDQIVSPRSALLIASRMNPLPIQTYHHASIRARRFFFSLDDGCSPTAKYDSKLAIREFFGKVGALILYTRTRVVHTRRMVASVLFSHGKLCR
jgi:hypothetical protein